MQKHMRKSVVIAILVIILLAMTVPIASASGGNYHTVYYGETLYSIGRHYGVNPYKIADVNNLYDPDHIYAGQVLYIPGHDSYQQHDDCSYGCNDRHGMHNKHDDCSYGCDDYQVSYDHNGCSHGCDDYQMSYDDYDDGYDFNSDYHVVRRGETLTRIAYYYGVSPWAIAEANHIYNLHRIFAGEVLYIPTSGNQNYY